MTTTYDRPIFDGDSHVHEKDFSFFERYLPEKYKKDWLPAKKHGPNGRDGIYIGSRLAENVDANPGGLVPPPGRLKEWLRSVKEGKPFNEMCVPPTPDMYSRDARVAKLDEFGVEACLLFCGEFVGTFGFYAPSESGNAVMHAYNQYLNDEWDFSYMDRLHTTGCLTLWDLDTSIKEAEWLIERGVRIVVMPMGPAHGKSPADPYFDPIWSRLNEAGVAVSFHDSEANFMHPLIETWGEKPLQ